MNPTLSFIKENKISCVYGLDPFTKKEKRSIKFSDEMKVRSVSPNEVVIEIDCIEGIDENKQQDYIYGVQQENLNRLKKIGFEVYIFDHKGKSPYLRMYDFEGLTKENQKNFFKLLVEQELVPLKEGFSYDESFYQDFHWCPLEFAEHWKPKYNGNKHLQKAVVNEGNKNKVNQAVLEIINKKVEVKSTKKFIPKKCAFVNYALENALPDGSNRNSRVLPNIVALVRDEDVLKQCADIQEKPFGEFKGWIKLEPEFNCTALRSYAGEIGKSSICNLCLIRGGV